MLYVLQNIAEYIWPKKINITISIVNIFHHTVTSGQFIKKKINIPFCFCFCLWSVKPVKI